MKNCTVLLISFVLAVSCGLSEVGKVVRDDNSNTIWGGPLVGTESGNQTLVPVCYMTAVEYPNGYDWRADQARETVRCSLVVYADGVPIMKIPVGADYKVSSDPDMHRMVGGHMYTDYSVDDETYVKRNGTLLFSYSAAERISGMHVCDGDVYTLGENRKGSGFSLRKNGEVKVQREEGCLLGPLRYDGDSLGFAFYEKILNAGGDIRRYYSVYGSFVSQVALREDIVTVWDVLRDHDELMLLASLYGIPQPVVIKGESMTALDMPAGASLVSGSIFKLGSKTGVEGVYKSSSGGIYNCIWVDGLRVTVFSPQALSGLCTYDDGVFCVLNPMGSSFSGKIYRAGEVFDMPQGYVCLGSQSMAVINGIMHVGMSSLTGERPLLWRDGQIDTLSLNGYISHISMN